MNIEELKQNFIGLLKTTGYDSEIVENFTEFIKTYNGTNEEEFKLMCFTLIGVLLKAKKDQIKSEAYDELVEETEELEIEADNLRNTVANIIKSGTLEPEIRPGNVSE